MEDLKVLAAKMAVAVRAEPGCRAYAVYQDIEVPTRFRIYEEWDDQAALTAHFMTPHMAEFNTSLTNLEIKSWSAVKIDQGEMSPVV